MPERLTSELRVLYGLVRGLAAGPPRRDDVVARACAEMRDALGLASVRPLDHERGGGILGRLADAARRERRPAAEGSVAVVPLIGEREVIACLAAEGRRPLGPAELELLSALGLFAGLLLERARREEELDELLADLRRVDELKTDFISVASHELRAPAAIVHGISSTLHLRGHELSEDQRAQLRSALFEQSSRLRHLIDQLLDLSRLEAGALRTRPERFRPRDWVEALLPRLAPGATGGIRVEIPPELVIETDPAGFERIVGNLLLNALEHGEPPVLVRAEAEASFCLVVEDRGDGVPEALVGQVFSRFARGESSGAGLGLAIARSYAEALGGTLHYETAEPRGARFVLELPEALPVDSPGPCSRSPAASS